MKRHLCIGTYTEEILFGTGELFRGKGRGLLIGTFQDGTIEITASAKTLNPSYVCVNERDRKIYTANEAKEFAGEWGGGVSQFPYEFAEGGGEIVCGEASFCVGGTDPCHIVLAPDKKALIVSNFASGSISLFPIKADGTIGGGKKVFTHQGKGPDPVRQKGPHAHSGIFSPDGRMLYVPDLGIDRVKAYAYQDGEILPAPERDVVLEAGSGPRFGEFSGDGKHFYLISELASQVVHFTCEKQELVRRETVSTLPENFDGYNICSDLHLTPDGRHLYASNRGHDSLACYRVEADGSLRLEQIISSGGKTPRNFCISPDGAFLLAGNQDSDNIALFAIQPDGCLKPRGEVGLGTPVCIKFFDG